ncbi:MAG: neutral/alkaline non-lysosomal ceramidase N-terminal domain-containing protein [Anaerolineae bacterium]|nr:neutral/alkaline non-lysosomal ceramidase N-terminal domain-containing protein [Anaerolineae bacterium]
MDQITYPFTRCKFGVAVRDATPPVGSSHASWGAAKHDLTEGIHKPLTATAAVIAPLDGGSRGLALVALDIGSFQNIEDERALHQAIRQATGFDDASLLINYSHTHGGTRANSLFEDRPGGNLIKPFLAYLTKQITDAVLQARDSAVPAWIAYGYGRCALAVNRDYWDSDAQKYACGYNPKGQADDTVMVARVTDDGGRILATMVNYACHPTTLAWDNKLLSPDYVGAMREVLEGAFNAPALFLQGAEGEISAREQYVRDTAVADRNGRILGYAAAAAIEALPPAGQKFVYTGIVASGTNLGTWAYQPASAEELGDVERIEGEPLVVDLPRKDPPSLDALLAKYDATDNRREKEVLQRQIMIQRALGPDPEHHMELRVWRLGPAGLVASQNEPYSDLQTTLRQRFPDMPLFVLALTNGAVGYMPPQETYGQGRYQEWQSPYKPGCLERVTESATEGLKKLFRS